MFARVLACAGVFRVHVGLSERLRYLQQGSAQGEAQRPHMLVAVGQQAAQANIP